MKKSHTQIHKTVKLPLKLETEEEVKQPVKIEKSRRKFKLKVLNEIQKHKLDKYSRNIWDVEVQDEEILDIVEEIMVSEISDEESSSKKSESIEGDDAEIKQSIEDIDKRLTDFEEFIENLQLRYFTALDLLEDANKKISDL